MNKITLGKTNLVIEKNGFGCLPIQRIREQDAVDLLHKAYDGGINFFDTARAYSDSEQKVGAAFSSMRDKIVLATKTGRADGGGLPEGSGDQSPHAENRLHRHLSVPQSRLLPEAGWRRRPVRRGARGEKAGQNSPHFDHEPPPRRGARGHRLGPLRDLAVSVQLPRGRAGDGARQKVPRNKHGLYRHEGHGGRPDPRRLHGGGVDGAAGWCRAHLGRAARERA